MRERFVQPLICHDLIRDGVLLIQRVSSVVEITEIWPRPRAVASTRAQPAWHLCRPAIRLDTAASPYREYFCTVPAGIRQFLGRFPTHQWELLCGVAASPAVLDLLRNNPALGWMSQVFWEFVPGAQPDAAHAAALAERRQRDIAAALGFPDAAWVARMLRKMPVECLSVRQLRTIRDLARDPEGAKYLMHLPRLDRSLVALLGNRRLLDMTTAGLVHELAGDGNAETTARVTLQLMEIGELRNEPGLRVQRKFASIAEVTAAWRRAKPHRERMHCRSVLSALRNPPDSYGALLRDSVLVPLETREDIIREAWEQRNCVAGYAAAADAGRVFLFRILRPERATLSLSYTDGTWELDQIRGPRNAEVGHATRWLVARILAAANGGEPLCVGRKEGR